MKRTTYQKGSVVLTKRANGPDVWVLRFRDNGAKKSVQLGTILQFPTKAAATRKAHNHIEEINGQRHCTLVSGLCDRYEVEGMPTRESTKGPYRSFLKRVRQDHGHKRLDAFLKDIYAIEVWLNNLTTLPTKTLPARPMASKSKTHFKAFVHRLIECAMRWNVIEAQRNPVALAELKGRRRRVRALWILSAIKFHELLERLADDFMMQVLVVLGTCLGLRRSELLGLRDEDFHSDFEWVHIQRSSVGKYQDDTKTDASEEYLPIHPELRVILREWFRVKVSVNGWTFESPLTGRPYHGDSLLDKRLGPAAEACGMPGFGFHCLRHSYRAMLRKVEAPLEVQQKLMRHADIRTTTEYGGAINLAQIEPANSKVVEMMLKRTA